MKLDDMTNKIQTEYYSLTSVQIKKGLDIISGVDCNATLPLRSDCSHCLILGECHPKDTRKEKAKRRLLKIMTEEKLNELLFDHLL